MFDAVESPYLVPFEGGIMHEDFATKPPKGAPSKAELRDELTKLTRDLDELQRKFYANGNFSLLLIFQALDAAGKDGTIRAVMRRIDPNGCKVSSFKAPSSLERAHDFLWRTTLQLPRKGMIRIFNRSYYEETLVVRVHPEYLKAQRIEIPDNLDDLWQQRFEAIKDHEWHLAKSGTVIVKFWLKHSKEEQRQRFLDRLNEPEKHWKFSVGDVTERGYWHEYMHAYQSAVNATSRSWAPWYVIPADQKAYMRVAVARIIKKTLKSLDLHYPVSDEERLRVLDEMREQLMGEE